MEMAPKVDYGFEENTYLSSAITIFSTMLLPYCRKSNSEKTLRRVLFLQTNHTNPPFYGIGRNESFNTNNKMFPRESALLRQCLLGKSLQIPVMSGEGALEAL